MPTWAFALLLVAGGNVLVLGLAVLRYVRLRRVGPQPAPAQHLAALGRVATVSRLRWTHHHPAHQERSRHRPGA